jgi:hypothetical protein
MGRRHIICTLIIVLALPARAAEPRATPWSLTAYYGPSTTKYFFAITQKLDLRPTGTLFGVALDRGLAPLGDDIMLGAELQGTETFFGHRDTAAALGLGFRADRLFGLEGVSFSGFMGPSYDSDPPARLIGYGNKLRADSRNSRLLNYVSAEIAVALPQAPDWYGVFRLFHRSSLIGLYTGGQDAGTAVGLGLQRRF